jgi:hypothetical protein
LETNYRDPTTDSRHHLHESNVPDEREQRRRHRRRRCRQSGRQGIGRLRATRIGDHDEEEDEDDADMARGANVLHRFKRGRESFRLPDLEGHDYAIYDLHLFWRPSGAAVEEDEDEDEEDERANGSEAEEGVIA